MYELASQELVSGSSRVIYACMLLLLLLFGVLMGMQLNGFPQQEFTAIKITSSFIYSPYLGAVLFATGIYLFLSVRRSDFPWILLVLYTALLGQQIGNLIAGGLLGAFLGALSMTGLANLIGKNYLTSIAEIGLFAMTVVAIALGLLVGALLTEPLHEKNRAPSGD